MRRYLAGILAFLFICSSATAQDFKVDEHYFNLTVPQPVATGDKIEVREMFWYGCPHCYRLEPYIQKWLIEKPENAEYVAMPTIFRDSWEFHARCYYTFEALGQVDNLHVSFFDAIHKQRKNIKNAQQLAEFAGAHGVDPTLVVDTFNSFAVETKTNQARLLTRKYDATGVPTIIVDGRYRTSVSSAGGHDALIALINFLVAKVASERQS